MADTLAMLPSPEEFRTRVTWISLVSRIRQMARAGQTPPASMLDDVANAQGILRGVAKSELQTSLALSDAAWQVVWLLVAISENDARQPDPPSDEIRRIVFGSEPSGSALSELRPHGKPYRSVTSAAALLGVAVLSVQRLEWAFAHVAQLAESAARGDGLVVAQAAVQEKEATLSKEHE